MSDDKKDPKSVNAKLTECIVAKGRTIMQEGKKFGPNQPILLDKAEADSFRKSGFIIDPQQPELVIADGPTFNHEAGPTITGK